MPTMGTYPHRCVYDIIYFVPYSISTCREKRQRLFSSLDYTVYRTLLYIFEEPPFAVWYRVLGILDHGGSPWSIIRGSFVHLFILWPHSSYGIAGKCRQVRFHRWLKECIDDELLPTEVPRTVNTTFWSFCCVDGYVLVRVSLGIYNHKRLRDSKLVIANTYSCSSEKLPG